MKVGLLEVIIGVLIFHVGICLAESEELEPKERYKTQSKESAIQAEQKEPKKELKLIRSFSQYIGIDNNVNLDSSRKSDTFFETAANIGIEHPFYLGFALWQDMKMKLTYNFTSIAYIDVTSASILDHNVNLNLQNTLVDRNILEFNYNFGVLDYPKYDPGDYVANKVSLGFKRYFTDRFYSRVGYGYLNKKYSTRKFHYGVGTLSATERKDHRHIAELEFGFYLWEKTLLKLREQYYLNNSNDLYYDYYDYSSNRVSLSAIHVFNDKLFGLLTFSERFKDYDHRPTFNKSATQEDELFTVNAALLYDFTPSTSVSLNVTYRENDSNEPYDEYAETVTMAGFHYSF